MRTFSIVVLALCLAGCQPRPTDQPTVNPAAASEGVIGTYRLKATEEQIAEEGGLDKLPTLVIERDHWRMIVEGEESSGSWKYESGKLTLSDKTTGENQIFLSDQNGLELVLQDEDPIRFVKFGVNNPQLLPKK